MAMHIANVRTPGSAPFYPLVHCEDTGWEVWKGFVSGFDLRCYSMENIAKGLSSIKHAEIRAKKDLVDYLDVFTINDPKKVDVHTLREPQVWRQIKDIK